jgi:hypothetical protein
MSTTEHNFEPMTTGMVSTIVPAVRLYSFLMVGPSAFE